MSHFTAGPPEAILWEFLSYPLFTADGVLMRFADLPGAIYKKGKGYMQGFVYIPGTRTDAATLIAHADTVFDFAGEHKMICEDGMIRSTQDGVGIGADDRAGCALLWLLKDSGHNILVMDGEERGQRGSHYLAEEYPDILKELQNSSFMVQLDRRNARDYKCYNIPVTEEFRQYIENETNYVDAGKSSRTDICVLCTEGCCGVNFSIGYYNEHTPDEYINVEEWIHTYNTVSKMLAKPLTRYSLLKA